MKKINNSHLPLYRDAGFNLKNTEIAKKAFISELSHPVEPENYIYGRYRNPTVVATEKQLADLEDSKWSLLTSSGMAAIDLALSVFQAGDDTGTWLFFSEIYGGTNSYIDLILKKKRSVDCQRFNTENGTYDLNKLEKVLDEMKPKLIYFEAVSNPMLIVADVYGIIKAAKKRGIKIIIDNTFATPYLWKPLIDGADLVIHSVTKYLAGHGNLTAGVVCGNDNNLLQEAIEYRKWTGNIISPDDAYRLSDYLKTFKIRIGKHCENAFKLAQFLEKHPKIEKIHYPGLKSHSTYKEALNLFKNKGYGGMICFDIYGENYDIKKENCNRFIDKLSKDIPLVPTLGDADTILLPVEPVWGEKYPFPGMIRLSVGIENFDYLENLLSDALNF